MSINDWHFDVDGNLCRDAAGSKTRQYALPSYFNALEARAQAADEDRKLAEWARNSLATTKKLHETYCTPKPGEDPTEVKWRFGIMSNGYELYKGPYIEIPDDPDAEGIVDVAHLHARGMPELADRLNKLETTARTAEVLLAALESIDETAGGSSIQGGFIGEMREIARAAIAQAHAAGVTAHSEGEV